MTVSVPAPPTDRTGEASPAARRDRGILYATRALRGFGAGALGVVLAVDLVRAGEPPWLAGIVLGLAIGGASAWSFAVPRLEGRLGKRALFVASAAMIFVSGFLLFLAPASVIVVVAAMLLGGVLASPSDVSPLASLEQSSLTEAVEPMRRTSAFVAYNLTGYAGTSLGALAVLALAGVSVAPRGWPAGPHDPALLLYSVLGLALIPGYLALRRPATPVPAPTPEKLSTVTRHRLRWLSGLFSVDAFAGGLLANSLVALWLEVRFGASEGEVAVLFAAASVLAGLSLALAGPVARRWGLVRTMVFTHLPSSLFLFPFALAPTLRFAEGAWVARATTSQMDVPARQSYVQAIVAPSERTAAAAYTTAARTTSALGPPVTGAFLAASGPWISVPLLLAGGLKIAYDLAVYRQFRGIRPPEETELVAGASGGRLDGAGPDASSHGPAR
jgi:MFS family permease